MDLHHIHLSISYHIMNPQMPDDGELLDKLVGMHSINYLRLQWIDFSGVQHAQMTTTRVARQLVAGKIAPFTVAQNCMIIPISTAPKSFAEKPQAWEFRPDWTSLRACGTPSHHASAMCFMYERGHAKPFAKCPRSLLLAIVKDMEQKYSTTLLVGFEAEFVLLDESLNSPHRNIDPSAGDSTMSGLRDTTLSLMESIVDVVELAGIHVHNFHTEGVGHFEIALAPMSTLCIFRSTRPLPSPKASWLVFLRRREGSALLACRVSIVMLVWSRMGRGCG